MPTAEEDIAYYRRRIDACVEQAMQAESLEARHAHETLARLYREKLAVLGADTAISGEQDDVEDGATRQVDSKAASRRTSQRAFSKALRRNPLTFSGSA